MEITIPCWLIGLGRDVLLLLPCNPGARLGDYFASRSWSFIRDVYGKKNIDLRRIQFAAVDSIITFEDPSNDRDELGAIVLGTPEEMKRVANHDARPVWSKFRKNNYEPLRKHSHYVEIGLKRVLNELAVKYLLVILNVRAYRLATYRALVRIGNGNIPQNTFFFDCPDSPAWLTHCVTKSINLLKKCLKENIQGGVIATTKKIKEHIAKTGRPKGIPQEFIYWNKKHKEILIDTLDYP